MDIKWKNNRNKKIIIIAVALVVLTVINMLMYPGINRRGETLLGEIINDQQQDSDEINVELLQELYKGCYVLYMEQMQRQSEENLTAAGLFIKEYPAQESDSDLTAEEQKSSVDEDVNSILEDWSNTFEQYRSLVDYYIVSSDGDGEKNTSNPLERALIQNDKKSSALKQLYNDYFLVQFDKYGNMNLVPVYDKKVVSDTLIKSFQQIDRSNLLQVEMDQRDSWEPVFQSPKNFEVILAIPVQSAENNHITLSANSDINEYGNYMQRVSCYNEAGAGVLYALSVIFLIILAFAMRSRRMFPTEQYQPPKWYLMEVAVVGIICGGLLENSFCELIWQFEYTSFSEMISCMREGGAYNVTLSLIMNSLILFAIYAMWFVTIFVICPVFSMGIREYVRQYSFVYQAFPWIRNQVVKLKKEVEHIDFSEKTTKTIVKVVIVNFLVLLICSFIWSDGVLALIIYSIIVFLLLKRYCGKISRNYQALLRGVNRMADGDLDSVIIEDLGVFEPFKAELAKIRDGFKKAVDEEVKSQRMKTELITNVSHDLKTPLTAITTYIELLKKKDITEEERSAYIETLEKKSLRLKVLIEDLFEVSKATSNNIVLHPMELDVVNLMKQVSVEHADKMVEKGLEMRWSVPEDKVILMLDNQKTYRIFENLFVNVQKYAMPGSRVFIAVEKLENDVEIEIKNMSADELNFKADEITERFVRGDSSRNTEGSGLGLAIAKSFTEAQKGKFNVEVDGDLFKVVIRFKCDNIEL